MPRARASVTGADALGRGRRLRSKTTAFFCCHFRRRFPAMAGVAKRLQVVGVDKQRPHAAVRNDVINVGSTCTHPTHGTGTAERLPQELLRAQAIFEDWQAVPLVPVSGLCASAGGVLWLVLWAVHLPRQHTAADVCARPEWLLCHGLSPPGKNKNARTVTPHGASAQARWLRLILSILTTDSLRQFLQYTAICFPSVSGNSRRTFCRWQIGQSRYPSLVIILPQYFVVCNTFHP